MFLGHFAVGLALKPKTRSTSLATLFMAAQWLDLIWPILVLLGAERIAIAPAANPLLNVEFLHYPYSHSLAAALVWGFVFAGVYFWRTGRRGAAIWLGLAVLSHWLLDFLSHRPDLPLAPGLGVRVGLGLWNHFAAAVAVEFALFAVGIAIYLRATRPRDALGRWSFAGLMVFLSAVYIASLLSPAPPHATAVAVSALAMWLLVLWAGHCDRHREPRPSSA